MSLNTSNSLIDLGKLSKPADTLIKKVSNAVGGLFAPYQVERMAKAEAKAAVIRAQSEIEITGLRRRAVHRWIEEEAQRQKNMEEITAKAFASVGRKGDPRFRGKTTGSSTSSINPESCPTMRCRIFGRAF